MTEPSSGNGTVQIAYLHDEHVSHSWAESMRAMWAYDEEHGGRRLARRPLNMRAHHHLAHVRNFAARLFLDRTPHEWLLFVDTDMGFEPDAVHRLLAAADPAARPVVGALCFAYMIDAADGMNGHRFTIVPTMYRLGETAEGRASFCYFGDYVDDEVTPVAATGGAFLLIHRSVLDKLRAEWGEHWFDQLYDGDGDIIGEDIAFCARALRAGVVPHVHTGVKTTHHKEMWLAESDYEAQRAVTVRLHPDLPVHVDLGASLETLAANGHVNGDMLKLPADLDRYRQIIEATRPDVIVETGTRTGGSARWFANLGVDVVTVDLNPVAIPDAYAGRVTQVVGDSADPAVVAQVAELVAGRRAMVSLDSDHSGQHVAAEIGAYGPLVAPGCYLVVEDGIFGHAPPALRAQHGLAGMVGSPLDAIVHMLVDDPGWSRDVAIERTSPTTHHPAGWWLRHG